MLTSSSKRASVLVKVSEGQSSILYFKSKRGYLYYYPVTRQSWKRGYSPRDENNHGIVRVHFSEWFVTKVMSLRHNYRSQNTNRMVLVQIFLQ